ncbi:MAG: alpha/beta fold hydrolase [Planctomycetes bacterium]|nr:alpha/beta fold hydrolase [Planctomycetota bacterium]
MKTLTRLKHVGQGLARAVELVDGATPHTVAWRSGPVTVRRYAPETRATDVPLVFVMPFINRFRVVDLEPGTSLVGRLVARGLEVFVVDWGAPRRIDAGIDFEDHVLRYLPRALAATGAAQVDMLGLCLGGTLSTIFAATHPERVRRLATLVAPVSFADMDLLGLWTDPRWFPVERLTAAFGNMPGPLVNQGFLWQKPMTQLTKLQKAWPRFDDPAFAEFFCLLESWTSDGVDVPGAAYRRLINDLYRGDRLAKGELVLRRGDRALKVDLGAIRCPVFVASATDDLICPPPAATALLDLVSTPAAQKTHVSVKGGHIAPLVGPKARASLQDPLADYLLS